MLNNAFKVLGIEPTNNGRVIRNAYVRLARIYHPDRFVGMPDDVRLEAERRMKEAAAAYESLRAARRTAAANPPPPSKRAKKDPWEEARRVRDTIAARRLELERSRMRWLLWDKLEREARDRAAYEASLVVLDGEPITVVRSEPAEPEAPQQSLLSRRLEAARGSRGDSLTRRA